MAITDFLSRLTQTRRFLRALDRIAAAQEQQTLLLRRIADALAPLAPEVSEADLKTSGPTFSRDEEQGRILEYCQRVQAATGRYPTEDEIVDWLDGKPVGMSEVETPADIPFRP